MRRKASEIPSRELNIGGISVTLEYRKVKNINLYIKPPDGRVLVTAPPLADVSSIRKFLESKEAWIRKNQEKVRKAFSDVSRGQDAGKGKGGNIACKSSFLCAPVGTGTEGSRKEMDPAGDENPVGKLYGRYRKDQDQYKACPVSGGMSGVCSSS